MLDIKGFMLQIPINDQQFNIITGCISQSGCYIITGDLSTTKGFYLMVIYQPQGFYVITDICQQSRV